MKRFLVFMAAALITTSMFGQELGDPNVRYAFPQVGTPYAGVTSPNELNEFSMRIQPNDSGFGIQDYQFQSLSHATFSPNSDNVSQIVSTDGSKYRISGNLIQTANVDLPQGAKIYGITLWAYDNSATEHVYAELRSNLSTSPYTSSIIVTADTGAAAVPGDYGLYVAAGTPVTVDAYANQYYVWLWNTGTGSSVTKFRKVTVWYKRQISPAPAVASFTDVPVGTQFFQFVEALKASGVTSGCTATTFCPNDPVTRAQMAAFLARALGLHWSY